MPIGFSTTRWSLIHINFLRSKYKEEMTFIMSKVSVALMLNVMSYLAIYCAAEDSKTAKETLSILKSRLCTYSIQIGLVFASQEETK